MTARACGACASFDREHVINHVSYVGDNRVPATARCLVAPRPGAIVNDTDVCPRWIQRPVRIGFHQDDGA